MFSTIRLRFSLQLLACALIISSCSIDINQTTAITSTSPVDSLPATTPTSLFPTTRIPVTWSHLNLTGKLVYVSSSMEGKVLIASIQMLDLATGDIATIFSAPSGAWIYYVTISPDAKQLILSYAPSSESTGSSNRSLYILPLDAHTPPQPLVIPSTPDDHYTQAEWSSDGTYIYYVHYNSNDQPDAQLNPAYDILRITYPDGQPEIIVDRAFWPRISSDSSRLVYVSLVPVSGLNELTIANVDGSNSQKVSFSGAWIPDIIDAPIFSPDGQSILFSAPGPSQSYQPNWLEKLMGIQVVRAHSVPSDWWSVPITGGAPTRLTNIQTINLFASISPDKKHVASLSGEGIFVMDLDGSNLTQLVLDSGVHGTVSWIP